MRTINWTENVSWQELVGETGPEQTLLVRDGHPIALLVPLDEDNLEWHLLEGDPAFLASIKQGRREVEQGMTLSHQDLKRDLGI